VWKFAHVIAAAQNAHRVFRHDLAALGLSAAACKAFRF
jgi:hypothetical protein